MNTNKVYFWLDANGDVQRGTLSQIIQTLGLTGFVVYDLAAAQIRLYPFTGYAAWTSWTPRCEAFIHTFPNTSKPIGTWTVQGDDFLSLDFYFSARVPAHSQGFVLNRFLQIVPATVGPGQAPAIGFENIGSIRVADDVPNLGTPFQTVNLLETDPTPAPPPLRERRGKFAFE